MGRILKILGGVVILAGLTLGGYAWMQARAGNNDEFVRIVVKRGAITEKAVAVGQIEPRLKFDVKSKISGIPRHGVGRALKVSKEGIVALLTALQGFVSGRDTAQAGAYREMLQTISAAVESPAVGCGIVDSGDGESPPRLEIALDEQRLGRSALEVCRRLRSGHPPVYVGHARLRDGVLVIHPQCISDDLVQPLSRRLAQELRS